MSEHSTYVPGNAVEKWLDDRLPVVRFAKEHLMDFPTPKNLNYWWTFGAILVMCLGVQIVTGIILAMHYTPNVAEVQPVELVSRARLLSARTATSRSHPAGSPRPRSAS